LKRHCTASRLEEIGAKRCLEILPREDPFEAVLMAGHEEIDARGPARKVGGRENPEEGTA
jgi:hypothetical protein